jgi:PEGA domain
MTRIPLSSSALAIVAFLVLAAPASLAGQGARQRGTASVQGQAVPRSEAPRGVREQAPPAPPVQTQFGTPPSRSEAPARVPPSRQPNFPNANATAVPRQVPRVGMPQVTVPQVVQPQAGTLRPNDRPVYRPDNRSNYRSDYRPNYRTQYQPNYRPLYRSDYRPYYRPYYSFLPRVRLGFGLWIGYPVRYPTYFYPYAYPYSYPYPYASTAPYPTYSAAASVGAAGGLSFEITPPEAGVYVDGLYIGTVGQFTPNQPPLSLAPGRHHIEIREPGFEIVAFDVDILPGQVIPYRGDLQPF